MIKSPADIKLNSVHKTKKHGTLKIVNYYGWDNVLVEFVDTKFITATTSSQIRTGSVKDKLLPSVCGVGFIGDGDNVTKINGKHTHKYQTWKSMIQRCYCEKYHTKKPTYIGVSVCSEWHNFQLFSRWYNDHYQEGLHLDKDIKIKGNSIYSPDTCTFVTATENTIEAHAKHYVFISPSGERVNVYGLSSFCKDNGLTHSAMSLVNSRKASHHKGWKRADNDRNPSNNQRL